MSGDSKEYIDHADDELGRIYDEPLSVKEYVEQVLENPSHASTSAKYLLEAIEYSGTRTVVEHGKEMERYIFFDDPNNDGEHAILGNTEQLNKFVQTLRNIAGETGKTEKMIWIEGPTATGKSEFKRCLVNGLREYSKKAAGYRYTVEWSEDAGEDTSDPAYHNPNAGSSDKWHKSPVQTHPLSLFPTEALDNLLSDVNERQRYPVKISSELDPFSKEFEEQVHSDDNIRRGNNKPFSSLINDENVRVSRYTVDIGQGIGVLHTEDVGNIKEKLVGSWIPTENLWSFGRRNPLAFAYDGVICQGNGLLTIIEDAASHQKLLQSLLNVVDENNVKIDQQTKLPLDTQFLIISNPDLTEALRQYDSDSSADPLRSLRRRLEKHEFNYLTNYSLEAKLLKREIVGTGEYDVEYKDEISVYEPLNITTYDPENINAREIAPHGIEAAAMYNVITRLVDNGLNGTDFEITDKAILFDQGELYKRDKRYTLDDVEFGYESQDGRKGIPVTFTRDVIAELITGDVEVDRENFTDVILPQDILNAMGDELQTKPIFSKEEITEFEEKIADSKQYVFRRQEEDVLQAAMDGLEPTEAKVEQYVDEVYKWSKEELETGPPPEESVDRLAMKLFETQELGISDEEDYDDDNNPTDDEITEFRENHVLRTVPTKAWESKEDSFKAENFDIRSMEVFHNILSEYGWEDVRREFSDFDPEQWRDPPENTQTEELRTKVTNNMIDMYDYSEKSAELTSSIVMGQVAQTWGDPSNDEEKEEESADSNEGDDDGS